MDKANVRIAYIVQCHKNATQVNLMIEALKTSSTDFYIHIDKKAKDVREHIKKDKQVILLPKEKCYDVKWGQISQVYATIALIREVICSGKEYDYVWFISGQHFPIKKNAEINAMLSNKSLCYIDKREVVKWDKRNDIYYPLWLINRNIVCRVLRHIYIAITGGNNHTYTIFKKKKLRKDYFLAADGGHYHMNV